MRFDYFIRLVVAAAFCFMAFQSQAKEIGMTEKQADEIIGELKKIRQLLEKGSPPSGSPAAPAAAEQNVKLKMADVENALGNDDAPLVMVEFTDYQCPYCRQYHISAFDEITKNFIDKGKLRYISRDYPLPFHDRAKAAANAVRCAGEQKHYWDYRHVVFVNSNKLSRDDLLTYAKDLQLDMDEFTTCLDSEKFKDAIQTDITDAGSIGISGTPSFVIGKLDKQGLLQGIKYVGAQPFPIFEKKLNALLQGK